MYFVTETHLNPESVTKTHSRTYYVFLSQFRSRAPRDLPSSFPRAKITNLISVSLSLWHSLSPRHLPIIILDKIWRERIILYLRREEEFPVGPRLKAHGGGPRWYLTKTVHCSFPRKQRYSSPGRIVAATCWDQGIISLGPTLDLPISISLALSLLVSLLLLLLLLETPMTSHFVHTLECSEFLFIYLYCSIPVIS